MRYIHISDLHLGKRLGEFRLYEEQSAVLDWILQTAVSVSADGILLAGDIFDRSVPPVDLQFLILNPFVLCQQIFGLISFGKINVCILMY